eukprot:CAMPEP_0168793230 /NCGR_PEP_ID=MMETSP0725-20121227/14975_1 /TAXON_ID=265536 /ORGANISM="Amphiprora sp., Strain CCMP467" /LENGTH=273 /DNA_ID=CAMNT_0008843993 /DNA_START=51 /DNA_END=872 /DNA_ORIENTATION=-
MTIINPAWELTDEEREATRALKQECDLQGVHYESVFQLVKYVLVVHSSVDDSHPRAAEKRLQKALKRLKQRNDWAEETGFAEIDARAAFLELSRLHPEYFVHHFGHDTEGRVIVAHHKAFAPTAYVKSDPEHKKKFLAMEQLRSELAAADMLEARRGISLVTITERKMTVKRAMSYLSLCMSVAQDNLSDMHQHRVKAVYSQVPALVAHLVGPAKRLLPRKIAERIWICRSMKELHAQIGYDESYPRTTAEEWLNERWEKYQATLEHMEHLAL